MPFLKAFSFGSSKSKHKKLPEAWDSCIKQPVQDGMSFLCKYLGSTLVDEPSSETVTAEAIKTIIAMAKVSGKKLSQVTLTIRPSGITSTEVNPSNGSDNPRTIDVSIYRISYCSADAQYDRVVAFIATNKNETLECHAFLTAKKKVAQAAALTISQAFNIAFEKWQNTKNSKAGDENNSNSTQDDENLNNETATNNKSKEEPALIDLSDENVVSAVVTQNGGRCSFDGRLEELEFDNELDDSFSRLAESRARGPTMKNKKSMDGQGNGTANPFLLPNNLNHVAMNLHDLNLFNYNNHAGNSQDGKFFSSGSSGDDSPDDLFSL